jgi:hypothetical protein
MLRREFITLLGSAAMWPTGVQAQAPVKIARIGFLGLAPASAWSGEISALRMGLRELGYVEGKNIILDFAWATNVSEMSKLANEFVRMNVDIIFAPASTQVEPAREATKTIPIVFAQHADPVGTGHVASLSHPGGNITGVSMVLTELAAKGLEILKQAVPNASRFGILWNPTQEVAPLALSATKVIPISTDDLDAWERRIEQGVAGDQSIPETDRMAIIRARKGQGLFKERVRKIESRCRITGVENPVHLVASHCKPWRDATNEERLDGENGLLLTPSIDHLFDRGFIGFEDNGRLIISPVAHQPALQRMGIDTTKAINVGAFTSGQKQFLDFHRKDVLLKSIRS